ncbi:MAG: TRAP transporter small permease subunit [Pseudomonadota bacterium]
MLDPAGHALNLAAALIFALYAAPLARLAGLAPGLSSRLAGAISSVNTVVGRTVKWFALAMVLVQAGVVLLRYVFNISLLWMQEIIVYLHGGLFLLAAGYVLHVGAHVRVDVFRRVMSEKTKALVDLLGAYLLLAPVCAAILIAAGPYVAQSWAVREGSAEGSGLGLIYLLKTFIPLFAALVALQGVALADRSVAVLRGEDEVAA